MPEQYHLIGLGTAVCAVVARCHSPLEPDRATDGTISIGRGGMICNTLAVAAACGAEVCGIIANGDDEHGRQLRETIAQEGVHAAYITTKHTPVTVTISDKATRSSIMGVDGERERDLEPGAINRSWHTLDIEPVWAVLTLVALDSSAGQSFVRHARDKGAHIAVTLSSAGHVRQRAGRLGELLGGIDLVFGNSDETRAVDENIDIIPAVLLETCGENGAVIRREWEHTLVPLRSHVDVIDTTGAGDAFAGGVLATLMPEQLGDTNALSKAVRIGHQAAAAVISQLGTTIHPETRDLLAHITANTR